MARQEKHWPYYTSDLHDCTFDTQIIEIPGNTQNIVSSVFGTTLILAEAWTANEGEYLMLQITERVTHDNKTG